MDPKQRLQQILSEVHSYEFGDVVALLPSAVALQSALSARLLALQNKVDMHDTDHLLTTGQVADRLGKSTKWIRGHVDTLPFAIRLGKHFRFSARGLEDWITQQQGVRILPALPL